MTQKNNFSVLINKSDIVTYECTKEIFSIVISNY